MWDLDDCSPYENVDGDHFDYRDSLESDAISDNSDNTSCGLSPRPRSPDPRRQRRIELRKRLQSCLNVISSEYKHAKWVELSGDLQNPGLWINSFGAVGLPLSERDAADLASLGARINPNVKAAPSTYGSLDFNCNEFELQNPEWDRAVQAVVKQIAAKFGIASYTTSTPERNLRVSLRNLSIRGRNGTYVPPVAGDIHEGTVGTLAIFLPSRYKGGALTLNYLAGKTTVPKHANREFKTGGAVWFRDVVIDAEPVQEGYLVVLTYDLQADQKIIQRVRELYEKPSEIPKALDAWLEEFSSNLEDPESILAFALSRGQSNSHLCIETLERPDRAVVRALHDACRSREMSIFLADLEIEETFYSSYPRHDRLQSTGRLKYLADLEGLVLGNNIELFAPLKDQIHDAVRDTETAPSDKSSDYDSPSYSRTVVLLVPNPCLFDLFFEPAKRGSSNIRPWLLQLGTEASTQSSGLKNRARHDLFRLCNSILAHNRALANPRSKPRYGVGSQNRPFNETVVKEIGQIALQYRNTTLVKDVISHLEQEESSSLFLILGNALREYRMDLLLDRTNDFLSHEDSAAKRFWMIRQTAAGFYGCRKPVPADDSDVQAAFNVWAEDRISASLESTKVPLDVKDLEDLYALLERFGRSLLEKRIVPAVEKQMNDLLVGTVALELATRLRQLISDDFPKPTINLAFTAIVRAVCAVNDCCAGDSEGSECLELTRLVLQKPATSTGLVAREVNSSFLKSEPPTRALLLDLVKDAK